ERRGAMIRGVLAGYGVAGDAYRITDTPPDGVGARHAMSQALERAALSPAGIDYINAHGTGTWLNDLSECRAIRAVFADDTERVWVSSTKAAVGHMIAAAGAVEAIVCLEALRTGLLPPTLNLNEPDPECTLRHVRGAAVQAEVRATLTNSFGFGGNNVSLVLTRDE